MFRVGPSGGATEAGNRDHVVSGVTETSHRVWQEIFEICDDLGLGVWLGVSDQLGISVGWQFHNKLQGVRVDLEDLQDPILLGDVADLSLPIALSCRAVPLVDVFDALDAVGSDTRTALVCEPPYPSRTGDEFTLDASETYRTELTRLRAMRSVFPGRDLGFCLGGRGQDNQETLQIASRAAADGATHIEIPAPLTNAGIPAPDREDPEIQRFHRMVAFVRNATRAAPAREVDVAGDKAQTETLETWRVHGPGDTRIEIDSRGPGNETLPQQDARKLIERLLARNGIGIFCQARVASSRLPRKALLPFYAEYNSLAYLLQRLLSYPGDIGQIVLATTALPEDEALAEIARDMDIPCYRGESGDVIGRMLGTAREYGWDVLIRITGDDQFASCEYVEEALQLHVGDNRDYTCVQGIAPGMECEVIDVAALARIYDAVVDKENTEHVSWFLDSPWICRNGVLRVAPQHRSAQYRLTLDYPEDYELMRAIASRCHATQDDFYITTDTVISTLFEMDPEWKHDEGLWPLGRDAVDTRLVYSRGSE
jgi:spore coat polysaccharide biosynthesis protein SpsF (cytidylyltransferase family)